MAERPPDTTGITSPLYWDLWIVSLLAVLMAGLALTPSLAGNPLRIGMAVFYVLFIPGYALISALFPEAGTLDGIERVALSFGLSIALSALIALVLNFTPWGIRVLPITIVLTVFTLSLLGIAGFRRHDLARSNSNEGDPYLVPFHKLPPLARDTLDELTGKNADSRLERILIVALIISIIFAAGSVAYALSTPRPGDRFTEFYLLTVDDDGTYVAGNYPTNLTMNESADVVVGIDSHEHKPMTYTIEIQWRDPSTNATSSVQTISDIRMEHNTTWRRNVSITPISKGTGQRLEFILYRLDRNPDTPYRRLHLRIDITAN